MEKSKLLKEFLIQKRDESLRADLFLARKIPNLSRSQVLELIKKKKVLLNQKAFKKSSQRLKKGDLLTVYLPEKAKTLVLSPYKLALDIVFEDQQILVVNKPAGLVVHPAPGHPDKTLVNALIFKKRLSPGSEALRPGVVHRLDKDTSGLVLLAKTKKTEEILIEQFKEHKIQRRYWAITRASPRPLENKIETWLFRHPVHRKKFSSSLNYKPGAKKAISFYKVLKQHESGICQLDCELKTGRTHQIRVHLSSIKAGIIGDKLYANQQLSSIKDKALKEELKKLNRVALHAYSLNFLHPISNKALSFKIPWPKDLKALLKKLNF